MAALLFVCIVPALSGTPGTGGATPLESPSQAGSQDQGSLGGLRQLAAEQIVKDGEFLGKTRFQVDLQNQTYFYDAKPVPARLVLADDDPYAVPLEALIRVEALRRDFRASVPNETFWIGALEAVEEAANACVTGADASPSSQSAPDKPNACSSRIQDQFDSLGKSISGFAAGHKLQLAMSQGRDPAPGFPVQIKIDPPKARVRVMTLLEYKKYQLFKTPADQYRWNDLLDSSGDMIGWYHYRAEWPAELNGPEEGDFCVKKPGTITFRPPQR
jgi:hypothetical protein